MSGEDETPKTHFVLLSICQIQESILSEDIIRIAGLILSFHGSVHQFSWFSIGFPLVLLALVHDKVTSDNQAVMTGQSVTNDVSGSRRACLRCNSARRHEKA